MPESKELSPLERAARWLAGLPVPDPEPVPDQGDQKKKPTEEGVK